MKGRKKLPVFLLLLLLLISLFQITISVESHDTSPALLKYVLQWPPTFCIQLNLEQESRCKEPVPQHEFTLHGLMPADEEGYNIECDYGEDPDWDELFGPIEDELVTFWPSLREDFNETELWKHEWRAHGSCGGTTPEEYFHKAIEINNLPEHGNLFNYIEASGLIPSDDLAYPKEHVLEAIQKLFDEFPPLIHDTKSLRRRPPPPRRSPPPPRRSPPPPRRSPPPPRRSPPPPRRSPPPPRRSPPPPRRSPPPPRRSPPPPRRSPPPPPRSPPPPRHSPPPPRRSPPPPPRSPPPPRFSPPPPPLRSPPPPPPSPSPPPPFIPPPPPSPPRNIYLSCIPINPENTTHVYLSEVTLCTNLDGNEYISCPSEAEPTSCPDEALIMLPLPKDQELDLPLDIWKTSMERISDV